MLVSKYDYQLPNELIAQFPEKERTGSRMLVLDRGRCGCDVTRFSDFPTYIEPGDCVVLNDTKVIPARLFGKRIPGGTKVEALLVENVANQIWRALLRPARRMKKGDVVYLNDSQTDMFRVNDRISERVLEIEFSTSDVSKLLNTYGQIPLPPYIKRETKIVDISRYQTVYATHSGAIAAPTAGLHFDQTVLQQLKDKNVIIAPITLHINLGTFSPIIVDNVEEHAMHSESYSISAKSAGVINSTRSTGGSVVAIGTSVVRALETCIGHNGKVRSGTGTTNLFLHPPNKPKVVDKLLTNFHLPKSTLLILVCTFAPRETVLEAYNLAIREHFRFYSYGDCMLLI